MSTGAQLGESYIIGRIYKTYTINIYMTAPLDCEPASPTTNVAGGVAAAGALERGWRRTRSEWGPPA